MGTDLEDFLQEMSEKLEYFELVYFNYPPDRIWCLRNCTDEGLASLEEKEVFAKTLSELVPKAEEVFLGE